MNEFIDHHAFLIGWIIAWIYLVSIIGSLLAYKQGVSFFEGIMNGFTPKFLRKTTSPKRKKEEEKKE